MGDTMSTGDRAPQPFLDWYGIWPGATGYEPDGRAWISDAPRGVHLAIQPAEKSAPFLRPEKPWERQTLNHFTVRYDDGRFKLWYTGYAPWHGNMLLYAESPDGFQWTKPALNLIEFEGSTENNIVLQRAGGGSLFVDPSAPDAERYKYLWMVGRWVRDGQEVDEPGALDLIQRLRDEGRTAEQIKDEIHAEGVVLGAVSPDGFRWTKIDEPVLRMFCDTQNIAHYDEALGKYVGYFRTSVGRRRSVGRAETDDFRHWPAPQVVFQPDLQDPITDDFYTSAYTRYPGGAFHLMFPSIYYRVTDTLDLQLATSRDGTNWTRPQRVPIVTLDEGENSLYASPDLVPLTDDLWGLPYLALRQLHNEGYYRTEEPGDGCYRWALWKRDRLVALEAPVEGRVTLNTQTCRGDDLRLNHQAESSGWIRVELIGPEALWPPAHSSPIPGFSFADCEPLRGDSLDHAVRWNGNSDLSALAGRQVCVRIEMVNAKLFSVSI
jgi:hypothetical protein